MHRAVVGLVFCATIAWSALAGEPAAPQLLEPLDGAVVTNPVRVRVAVAPPHAQHGGGTAGHLHLVIDAPVPPPGSTMPSDAKHRHLMHGEAEVRLTLPPGRHTLQLVAGTAGHRIGNPAVVSPRITIEVAADAQRPGS